MDRYKVKYLVVIDLDGVVVGTLTDGDIRRYLIKNPDLSVSIDKIMNRAFKYVYESDGFDSIVNILHYNCFDFIPILDSNGKLHNLITRHILNALLLTNNNLDSSYDFDSLSDIVIEHEIFVRPWGYYKTMVLNKTFQSKVIYILPKQRLSLQSHKYRDEYWTIISGKGCV